MSAPRPCAWVFNLDAEDELRDLGGFRRSSRMRASIAGMVAGIQGLVEPGDRVLELEGPQVLGDAYEGRAWCPTPGAQEVLRAAGVVVPEAPAPAVLRRVNGRRFSASLSPALPGALYLESLARFEAWLEGEATPGRWVLKAELGYAGRGRRRFELSPGGRREGPEAALETARGWVVHRFAEGDGVALEPWLERTADFALHGWVPREGAVVLGRPTSQVCDAEGRWLSQRRVVPGELAAREQEELLAVGARVGDALRAEGYWGPFGVDAFRWRTASGEDRFHPLVEVNARYTMGWGVGMAGRPLPGR